MSLSNKLTLDKVDVNGKRVVMRYVSRFPSTPLIGCEIICRLLPNCRVWGGCTGLSCIFPKTLSCNADEKASNARSAVWESAPTLGPDHRPGSRKWTCHVFIHVTCLWGDAAWMQRRDVVLVPSYSNEPQSFSSPLCRILSFRRHFVFYSTAKPWILCVSYQTRREMSSVRLFCCTLTQICHNLRISLYLERFSAAVWS